MSKVTPLFSPIDQFKAGRRIAKHSAINHAHKAVETMRKDVEVSKATEDYIVKSHMTIIEGIFK